MLRADLICTDGSVISITDLITVKEKIGVFLPQPRRYCDLITFEKGIGSINNLWDTKYQLVGKDIESITIYGPFKNEESNEIFETTIGEWKNVKYCFHGVYREIRIDDGVAKNNMYLTIISNKGSITRKPPEDTPDTAQ